MNIEGIGVSPGIAIGKAYLFDRGRIMIPHHRLDAEDLVEVECARFEEAVVKAE